jgi:leucyl-tRNA synthetase
MTDDTWEFIFGLGEETKSDISRETLEAMRREFTYWYPLDVRISGKDLVRSRIFKTRSAVQH